MRRYAESSSRRLLFCVLWFLCTFGLMSAVNIMSSEGRYVTRLIHRDSIFSPYYNPNHTDYDRAEQARASSLARYAFLSSRVRSYSIDYAMGGDYQAEVLPPSDATLFLANISLGEPPVPQLVAMDTGSTLLWVQCYPCETCSDDRRGPLYDRAKSLTCRDVPCQNKECETMQTRECDREDRCHYWVRYLDGTNSQGELAWDQVTMGTSDDGISKISDVVIGCGHQNGGETGQFSGILGLGPRSQSLTHRLGNKFSYCVGSIYNTEYPFNQLAMGATSRLEGYTTPLELGPYEYYVKLEGISIGDIRLNVRYDAFQGGPYSGGGGVIIDTGTTFSHLVRDGYLPLKDAVTAVMETGQVKRLLNGPEGLLCFEGKVSPDLNGFPAIIFHFAGGTDLVVDSNGMFRQIASNSFCMAVMESPEAYSGLNIIGMWQQQFYNVGYDLEARKLYFQRVDCEVYES